MTGDEVLVAAGRAPQAAALGLETVGAKTDGFVAVDEHMRVPGLNWLYVVGDLNGRALFAHMAKYQAAIAAGDILGRDMTVEHVADGANSPRVIFTEPQVAAVEHTTASAAAAGLKVRVIDEDNDVLVGVTITGTAVADFLQAATIAILGEVPVRRLRHAIPAFPHPQ